MPETPPSTKAEFNILPMPKPLAWQSRCPPNNSAISKSHKSLQSELSLKHRHGIDRVISSIFESPRAGSALFPQANSVIVAMPCSGSFTPLVPHPSLPTHIASDPLNNELGAGSTTSFLSSNAFATPTEYGERPIAPLLIQPNQHLPPQPGYLPHQGMEYVREEMLAIIELPRIVLDARRRTQSRLMVTMEIWVSSL